MVVRAAEQCLWDIRVQAVVTKKSRAGLGPSPSMIASPQGPGGVVMTQLQVSSCSHVVLPCGSCGTVL